MGLIRSPTSIMKIAVVLLLVAVAVVQVTTADEVECVGKHCVPRPCCDGRRIEICRKQAVDRCGNRWSQSCLIQSLDCRCLCCIRDISRGYPVGTRPDARESSE